MRPRSEWVVVALLSWCTHVDAGPADAFGLGTRARAMGGAATATTEDFAASYYNPARLTYAAPVQLSGGYYNASHSFTVNGQPTPIDDVSTATFGLVVGGTIVDVPVAVGIATSLDGRRLTRLGEVGANEPEWVRYKSRNRAILFATNLAIRPLPWLAVGGGMSFLASSEGSFQVRGVLVQGPDGAEYDSQLEHSVDYKLTRRVFPQLGVSVDVAPPLTLALAYHEERQISVRVEAAVVADIRTPTLETPGAYEFTSRSIDGFIPRDVTLGAAYEITPALLASFDLTWAQWSAYPTPLATVRGELFLDRDSGVGLATAVDPPQISAHDVFVPRLGIEYTLGHGDVTNFPLRAGYFFEDSPIEHPTPTNFVDAPRHVLSLGAAAVLGGLAPTIGTVSVGFDVSWSLLAPSRIRHEPPASVDCCTESEAAGDAVGVGFELAMAFD